jgi:glutathione S-transferase
MRLHHSPFSANARRAVMTAMHLGLVRAEETGTGPRVELAVVDLAKGEQRSPAYLKLNPNGRVPTLEDGTFALTESHAIMQYLADLTPGQTIYPTETRARANVNRWLFWNAHHFAPAIAVLNWENVVKKMTGRGDPDPKELARGEMLIGQTASVLDAHLTGREWIAEDKLTLADLAIGTPLMSMVPAKLPVTQYANLQKWLGRVQELSVWKKTGL